MSNETIHELREFHRFLGEKLGNGGAELSPEEVLDEWRQANPDKQADDVANGDKGMLFEDFDREFRERHHLPSKR